MSNATNKKNLCHRLFVIIKISFLISISFAISLHNSYAQNTWTQKADFKGTARHGAAGFSIGTKGYIGIGYDGLYKKDLWEYDPATDAWSQKANFGGTGRHVGVGFSIGNKGYIGTGAGPSGEFKDFWEYDPATNSWTQKADVGGLPRHGAVGFSIGNKGYVGTGHNSAGNVLNDLWEYDPATDKWTQKANFGGTGRLYAAGFSIGNKGYVGLGNTNENAGTDLKDFWEYDPSTDSWTREADFAGSARHGVTAFSIGSKGYVGTGQVDESAVKNDFWEYDPATNAWTQKANFGGAARGYAAGFSIGNNGYIGTGLDEINGYTHYKDLWAYTPDNGSCQPPSELKVIGVTDSSAKLGWTLPTSSIVGIIIHYHPAGNPVWREKLVQPTKASTTLNNLLPNTTYKWKIESVCSNKLSTWVNGPDFTTGGLIAWYPFNGNAHDETGHGYNGTVSGATLSDDRFGNPNSAYSFDGIDDEIVIGKEPNFPSWDTYAVSLWFLNDGKGDQSNGYGQKILSKAQYYTDFHLSVQGDVNGGRLTWWSAQGGFNSVDASNQDYRDNQWHHVVLNKQSPTKGDIWVDGVLKNSSDDLQAVFNNEDLVIGFTTHRDSYQRKHWSGKIDDIRIYNRVLSDSEILDLFNEGGSNFASTASPLSQATKASVYPNPAQHTVTVNYTAEKSGKYIFEITGITGNVLLHKETNAMPGGNVITFDVSRFINGLYFINIIKPGGTREKIQLSKE